MINDIKEGYLKVSNGHGIYYATAGEGMPLLKIHGGPGGSCKLDFFEEIDLTKYKVIIFDQRGCGKGAGICGKAQQTPGCKGRSR